MRSPVCSVIIAASSRLEQLALALAPVRMQLAAGVEVIVLDDGSNAGVSAWLAIAAMGAILSPYEHFPVAWTRHAAAKNRAKLDCARAGLSRPVTQYASAARGGSRTFMASTQAKAASVHAALNFASAYGAGK